MPVIEEKDDPGDSTKRVLRFATTPRMSTYALAFLIGEYEYIEKQSKTGVTVRVYTKPGQTKQAQLALETAIRFLDFHIFYPLPKLDLIAFIGTSLSKPFSQFTWGLIICNDYTLCYNVDGWRYRKSFVENYVASFLAIQTVSVNDSGVKPST